MTGQAPQGDPRPQSPGLGPSVGPSVGRSLGRFVGHLWWSVRPRPKAELRREVQEASGTTADGRRVVVRRTTIEEIEVDRG